MKILHREFASYSTNCDKVSLLIGLELDKVVVVAVVVVVVIAIVAVAVVAVIEVAVVAVEVVYSSGSRNASYIDIH